MEVIGHRGALNEALENSLESFRLAVDAGATRIELDVQLLQDNGLIVIHDNSLERTTQGKGKVSALTSHQIREIKLKNGEEIPFLETVIKEILPKIELNIELKAGGQKLAEQVLQILPPLNSRLNKIIISSFDIDILEYISQNAPEETLAVLWEGDTNTQELANSMKRCNSSIFHPEVKGVTKKVVENCKMNDWSVIPYISNHDEQRKEEVWQSMLDLQVDGLCTNYPRELVLWLKNKKQ